MGRSVQRAILESIRKKQEDSEMQIYAAEPAGAMGEESPHFGRERHVFFNDELKAEMVDALDASPFEEGHDYTWQGNKLTLNRDAIVRLGQGDPSVVKLMGVLSKGHPTGWIKKLGQAEGCGPKHEDESDDEYAERLKKASTKGMPALQKKGAASFDMRQVKPRAGDRPPTSDEIPRAVEGEDDWVTLDEMDLSCEECADEMRKKKMTRIKRSAAQECMSKFGK